MWCVLGLVCKITTAPKEPKPEETARLGILWHTGWANLSTVLLFLLPHLPSSSSFPKIITKSFSKIMAKNS